MEMQHRVSFLYFQPAYDSTRTLLYWLTMWAAYRFEKNRSSVKNVQIPTLQLEEARSSDKPLPMQICLQNNARMCDGPICIVV